MIWKYLAGIIVSFIVWLSLVVSGGSKNSEKGGRAEDNLSVPVLIYRKCTQQAICLLHEK